MLETILVGMAVLGATFFWLHRLRRIRGGGNGCGCGCEKCEHGRRER